MQVLCPYYIRKRPHESNVALTDVRCYLSSLSSCSESILKQLIKHLFHTFLLLFRFKSKYGCPISSKITKLYFILNTIQLPKGLKII